MRGIAIAFVAVIVGAIIGAGVGLGFAYYEEIKAWFKRGGGLSGGR